MADITFEAILPLAPAEAFELYVQQIDVWWPRQGVFPYSFAPKTTSPGHIRFEGELGGRFFETFADGSHCLIGRITAWEPPGRLAYTWRDPSWAGDTTITVAFSPHEGGTRFVAEQDGFAAAGVPELPPFYAIGNRQTLAGFVAHCRAIFELGALQAG